MHQLPVNDVCYLSCVHAMCVFRCAQISDVHHVGSFAGYNLLEALGEKLEVSALQRYSRNELQALFLLLTGTILAINYCPEQSNIEGQRRFLSWILAHYMVCVAWRLNLPFNLGPGRVEGLDKDILLDAPHQWHREGSFEWSSMDLEVVPTISSSRSGDKTAIEIESRSMTCISRVSHRLRHSLGLRRHVETHHNTASAGSMKPFLCNGISIGVSNPPNTMQKWKGKLLV
ncbi:hypothetical protein BKA65DRAFT_16528 [Rhexocercosporidium sp. MPI-PUGE-AT-0058]|nr:hypothetical protein BKA65DRAFT_16528 [Rhexocercosporidium sp. MPI-PUGE-AT-0058]